MSKNDATKEIVLKYINKPFRYYSSGRMLFVSGAYDISVINIGYALDLLFKWCLQLKEVSFDHRKHNLKHFYDLCIEHDVVKLNCSSDLIDYLDSLFNARYPFEIERITKRETESKNRFMGISSDFIHCCDDLILQLDDGLSQLCAAGKASIFNYALSDFGTAISRSFWHCNYSAFSRLKKFKEDIFEETREKYWSTSCLPFEIPFNNERLVRNFASEFKFDLLVTGATVEINYQEWTPTSSHNCFFSGVYFTLPEGEYKIEKTVYRKPIKS